MAAVAGYVRSIFPSGTRPETGRGHAEPPLLPTDTFAAVAGLLETSGIYQFAFSKTHNWPQLCEPKMRSRLEEIGFAWAFGLPFASFIGLENAVAAQMVHTAINGFPEKSGELKSLLSLNDTPTLRSIEASVTQRGVKVFDTYGTEIRNRWKHLVSSASGGLVLDSENLTELPNWWTCAYELLAIADEAAFGVGLTSRRPDGSERPRTQVQSQVEEEWFNRLDAGPGSLSTTAFTADDTLVCVQPKTRTPNVGCTLRSLSHNLAHLPGRGLASVEWVPSMSIPKSGSEPFNALLIPFPFYISAKCFEPKKLAGQSDWGEFHVRQRWLYDAKLADEHGADKIELQRNELVKWITGLARQAQLDCGNLNAIIFPEYALDCETLMMLCNRLVETNDFPSLEIVISGLSNKFRQRPASDGDHPQAVTDRVSYTERETGNYAAVCRLNDPGGVSFYIRGKHHRWKLDRRQIEKYALAHRLDPNKSWWEGISLEDRRIGVHEFRAGSTMSVLICEDLARADPCQRLVRSIGPNLVVALLMDGPQLKARWPAHYAGVLADDPGSSVLTLTSLGLIERAAAAGAPESRTIALWKGHNTDARELRLPNDRHGLVVTLTENRRTEKTLDGREDGGTARVWSLSGSYPVKGDGLPSWMETLAQ